MEKLNQILSLKNVHERNKLMDSFEKEEDSDILSVEYLLEIKPSSFLKNRILERILSLHFNLKLKEKDLISKIFRKLLMSEGKIVDSLSEILKSFFEMFPMKSFHLLSCIYEICSMKTNIPKVCNILCFLPEYSFDKNFDQFFEFLIRLVLKGFKEEKTDFQNEFDILDKIFNKELERNERLMFKKYYHKIHESLIHPKKLTESLIQFFEYSLDYVSHSQVLDYCILLEPIFCIPLENFSLTHHFMDIFQFAINNDIYSEENYLKLFSRSIHCYFELCLMKSKNENKTFKLMTQKKIDLLFEFGEFIITKSLVEIWFVINSELKKIFSENDEPKHLFAMELLNEFVNKKRKFRQTKYIFKHLREDGLLFHFREFLKSNNFELRRVTVEFLFHFLKMKNFPMDDFCLSVNELFTMSKYMEYRDTFPNILCGVLNCYDIVENSSELLSVILDFLKEDVYEVDYLLKIVEILFQKKSNLSITDHHVVELMNYFVIQFESENSKSFLKILKCFFQRFKLDSRFWFKKCFKICISSVKDLIPLPKIHLNNCLSLILTIIQIFKNDVESYICSTNFVETIISLIEVLLNLLKSKNKGLFIEELIISTCYSILFELTFYGSKSLEYSIPLLLENLIMGFAST
jgi:hypothetical protein